MVSACGGVSFSPSGKEILTRAAAQVSLEDMMLTEISQTNKDKYWATPLTRSPQRRETESRRAAAGGCGEGHGESGCDGDRVSVLQGESARCG